jgi:hypothetical protein
LKARRMRSFGLWKPALSAVTMTFSAVDFRTAMVPPFLGARAAYAARSRLIRSRSRALVPPHTPASSGSANA